MVDGEAGKGDRYRKVDRKKWDKWWDEFEKKKNKTNGIINRKTSVDN